MCKCVIKLRRWPASVNALNSGAKSVDQFYKEL